MVTKDKNYGENGFALFATFIGASLQMILVALPKDLFRWIFSRRRKSVRGQTIVITGGASGIGYRIAELFADPNGLGAKVAIIDINLEGAQIAAKKIREKNGNAQAWKFDVAKADEMRQCAKEVKRHFGQVDIVMCNAALLQLVSMPNYKDEDIQKLLDVNVLGTINTIRAFLPELEAQGRGQIVAMASIAGHFGEAYELAYCASKFAVRGAMESLRIELRERDFEAIVCTTICPFYVRSPMVTSKGVRPVARWIPFMTVERCADKVIDAILREKVSTCIPWWLNMFVVLNGLFGIKMQDLTRDFLNCHFEQLEEEDVDDELRMNQQTDGCIPKMVDTVVESKGDTVHIRFDTCDTHHKENCSGKLINQLRKREMRSEFAAVRCIWYALIPPGILLLSLNTFAPQLFAEWLGQAGEQIYQIGSAHHSLFLCLFLAVCLAHLACAVWSMYVSDCLRLSHKCALFWFGHSLLLGLPPVLKLRNLLAQKAN